MFAKQIMNTMAKKERNIAEEVFNFWQECKKQGDGETLQLQLGLSAPTISQALKYGYVSKSYLVTAITEFFKKRKESEITAVKPDSSNN